MIRSAQHDIEARTSLHRDGDRFKGEPLSINIIGVFQSLCRSSLEMALKVELFNFICNYSGMPF